MNWNRREFFKKAAALAGGLIAGLASTSRKTFSQEHPDGEHDMAGMEHEDLAEAMEDGKGYPGGHGSMMFMRGHNMIGAYTEPTGAPSDDEVDYRTFRIHFEITDAEGAIGLGSSLAVNKTAALSSNLI